MAGPSGHADEHRPRPGPVRPHRLASALPGGAAPRARDEGRVTSQAALIIRGRRPPRYPDRPRPSPSHGLRSRTSRWPGRPLCSAAGRDRRRWPSPANPPGAASSTPRTPAGPARSAGGEGAVRCQPGRWCAASVGGFLAGVGFRVTGAVRGGRRRCDPGAIGWATVPRMRTEGAIIRPLLRIGTWWRAGPSMGWSPCPCSGRPPGSSATTTTGRRSSPSLEGSPPPWPWSESSSGSSSGGPGGDIRRCHDWRTVRGQAGPVGSLPHPTYRLFASRDPSGVRR